MSKTYNNVPMSGKDQERVVRADSRWSGPKLIVLAFVVLGAAFALLWAAADGVVGPDISDTSWHGATHFLQRGCAARPWD